MNAFLLHQHKYRHHHHHRGNIVNSKWNSISSSHLKSAWLRDFLAEARAEAGNSNENYREWFVAQRCTCASDFDGWNDNNDTDDESTSAKQQILVRCNKMWHKATSRTMRNVHGRRGCAEIQAFLWVLSRSERVFVSGEFGWSGERPNERLLWWKAKQKPTKIYWLSTEQSTRHRSKWIKVTQKQSADFRCVGIVTNSGMPNEWSRIFFGEGKNTRRTQLFTHA